MQYFRNKKRVLIIKGFCFKIFFKLSYYIF